MGRCVNVKSSWLELLENKDFETFQGLPWLFDAAKAHKIQWQGKLNYYNSLLDQKIQFLPIQINNTADEITKIRLTTLYKGLVKQKSLVEALLPELKTQQDALLEAIQDRIPSSQFIGKYINNIFRDWAWGEKEIEAAVKHWLPLFPKTEGLKFIFLGAGSCRLPLEIHKKLKPEFSIATDINPLLLTVADKLIKGEKIELVEFPQPVIEAKNVAIEHTLQNSLDKTDNFHLVYADAINSPFKEKAFDVVATPWLIDILPISFQETAIRINNSLKDGGFWLNSGPLSYSAYEKEESITPDELASRLEKAGFSLEELISESLPYLQSKYSAQKREETVISFRAKKKTHEKRPKKYSFLPEYLTDITKPITATPELGRIYAQSEGDMQLLTLIDNKRSINDLADLIAKQSNVNQQEIVNSLIAYFVTLFERSKTK